MATTFDELYQRTLDACPDRNTLGMVFLSAFNRPLYNFTQYFKADGSTPNSLENMVKDAVEHAISINKIEAFEAALTRLESGAFKKKNPPKVSVSREEDSNVVTAMLDAVPLNILKEYVEKRAQREQRQM